jgi:L-ornithine Nalpha-acyltransferase
MPFRAAAGAAAGANEADLPDFRPVGPGSVMPVGIVEPPSSRLNPAFAATRSRTEPRIVDLSAGPLQVRLAEDRADIDAAQALRYRVFYETMGALPLPGMAQRRRDFDPFDDICDHLLVIDHDLPPGAQVIGTYRLIRRNTARRCGRFYSSGEYDIENLIALPGEILELGRSCVDPLYRGRGAMQLLWGGIAAYVFHYEIGLMFGCASLPGTDPKTLAEPLSYLYHEHLAPPELRVRALDERYVDMNLRDAAGLDGARIRAGLPPLIKGYLRLGGFVGDGAVIDTQFNTTDVCVLVKTDLVAEKYSRHYVRTVKDP